MNTVLREREREPVVDSGLVNRFRRASRSPSVRVSVPSPSLGPPPGLLGQGHVWLLGQGRTGDGWGPELTRGF